MLDLLKNEEVVFELTKVIAAYETLPVTTVAKETSLVGSEIPMENITDQPLVEKEVKQVSKRPRTSQEFRINAQIGEYDRKYCIRPRI